MPGSCTIPWSLINWGMLTELLWWRAFRSITVAMSYIDSWVYRESGTSSAFEKRSRIPLPQSGRSPPAAGGQ
jgi:hypothetical protein